MTFLPELPFYIFSIFCLVVFAAVCISGTSALGTIVCRTVILNLILKNVRNTNQLAEKPLSSILKTVIQVKLRTFLELKGYA